MTELTQTRSWLPPTKEPDDDTSELLSFEVGAETYAFPLSAVHEILKPPPMTPVPRAPAHVLGVVSVRGRIVTVLDPSCLLGLEREPECPSTRILMVDNGSELVGVSVHRVLQVVRMAPEDIEYSESSQADLARYVIGIGRPSGSNDDQASEETMLILLDPLTLLGES